MCAPGTRTYGNNGTAGREYSRLELSGPEGNPGVAAYISVLEGSESFPSISVGLTVAQVLDLAEQLTALADAVEEGDEGISGASFVPEPETFYSSPVDYQSVFAGSRF